MDYKKLIEDLNADIYEEFGIRPCEDGYVWSYNTNGYIDSIFFYGLEIYNSENWSIEADKDVSELSMSEFEDMLEEKVLDVAKHLLLYSFVPRSTIDELGLTVVS